MTEKKNADTLEAELSRLKTEFEALKEKLGEKAAGAAAGAAGELGRARAFLAPELERAEETVRAYPLLSLLLAGAFGFLLGRLAR